jgi:cell wall-associated NlpC family hydrolase
MNKMKCLLFLSVIFFFALACNTLKPQSSDKTAAQDDKQKRPTSLEFISDVSIKPVNNPYNTPTSSGKATYYKQPHIISYHISAIEDFSSLQFKYAILEDALVEEMQNEKLLGFMEQWYGAKYHFGGNGKEGIDCSAFSSTLMSSVYGISNLPRMARDQYIAAPHVGKKQLQEGDLVFFHTYGKRKTITHVGVYLRNNKFIHASISGVMISDMGVGYYASHFVGAGRLLESTVRDAGANSF